MGLVEVLFNVAFGKGGRKLSRSAGFRWVTEGRVASLGSGAYSQRAKRA